MPPKKESQAAKAAWLAKEKKDKERAAKERKETANARAQANAQEPAPTADRIPKKKTRNGVEFSSSDSDSAKSNSAEDREDDDGSDTEVEDLSDLAAGDAACRVTNCGLGNALSTNCPQHQKAAKEQLQAANVPRERRKTTAGAPKQAETVESSSTPTKQPARDAGKKGKQSTRRSNKHVESQVQQTLTEALAPYLEQFQSMLAENAARAVRPCSTGYIR
jgi:hypothetical protein